MDTLQVGSYKFEECWYRTVCDEECNPKVCVKYIEMSYLMENSNLPKAKQKPIKLSIPARDKEAYMRLDAIRQNIDEFVSEGRNLYIGSSSTGTGKTSWAIKLMHNYFNQIWDGNGLRERALFIHVPTFLMKCKNFDVEDNDFYHIRKLLETIDLVVWDDIASTDMTAFDIAHLVPYIDYRRLSELSNIFTANYDDRDTLSKVLGDRLTSRVWSHNSTEVIIFKGGDIR